MPSPLATAPPPDPHTALTAWADWMQAGRNPPDPLVARIDQIIQHMEANGRWKEARVLRADRLLADLPEPQRLYRLSRIGLRLGHSSYYAYLRSALAYVEGALYHPPQNRPRSETDRAEQLRPTQRSPHPSAHGPRAARPHPAI